MDQIPVLDISQIGLAIEEPEEEIFFRVGKELNFAFSKIGFVYITGHGIEKDIIDDAMNASKEFFELEELQKCKSSRPNPLARDGWVSPGRETFIEEEEPMVHEFREAFDVNSFSENVTFPSGAPEFKPNLMKLANRSVKLSHRLLTCISLALGKHAAYFSDLHTQILGGKNASALRSLYYPAIKGTPPEGFVRCSEHSDYGTFTLLFQDKNPGLEVKSASGGWVSADPVPGTILVNIGDLLEIWTGGRFPATRHRVIIPVEEIKKAAPRQSIVLFVHPDNQVLVNPLGCTEGTINPEVLQDGVVNHVVGQDGVVNPVGDQAKNYRPVVALDHVQRRFLETYKY